MPESLESEDRLVAPFLARAWPVPQNSPVDRTEFLDYGRPNRENAMGSGEYESKYRVEI